MAEFQRHPSDASMFLAAARAFCLNRRSTVAEGDWVISSGHLVISSSARLRSSFSDACRLSFRTLWVSTR